MTQFQVLSLPGFAGALLLLAAATDQRSDIAGDEALVRLAAQGLDGPVAAHVERVIDGDTIEVIATIWLGQTLDVHVRIDGIDTPELEARCPEERTKALAARDFLARRLNGAEVRLSHVVYDKYGGRVRASVADAHGDIGQAMLAAGLARAYHGDKRLP